MLTLTKIAEYAGQSREFPDSTLVSRVYRDSEWSEFRVRFYLNGTLQPAFDYHTSDRDDAEATARCYIADRCAQVLRPMHRQ